MYGVHLAIQYSHTTLLSIFYSHTVQFKGLLINIKLQLSQAPLSGFCPSWKGLLSQLEGAFVPIRMGFVPIGRGLSPNWKGLMSQLEQSLE